MNNLIKILQLSDIHLGNKLNSTEKIVNALKHYFRTNQKEFSKLSMIVLVGDVYDRLLNTSSSDYILSIEWLTELVIFCKNNNIKLRILEGTPSHDWKQCKVLYTIIDRLNLDVDFKYIETLHIEIMSDLNLSVLYVPDEWKHKASETYNEILELMVANNLSKVDVAFMHGQFHYQLPMIRLESSFSEEDMLNIVKYYISIGHIHTPSVFERILAQGSFDRLAHNEEEDKGGIVVTIDKSKGDYSYRFIKNEKAMLFKTYKYTNEELDVIIADLEDKISRLPKGTNVRIISENEDYITKSVKAIKDKFLDIVIKAEKPKVKDNKFKILEEELLLESFSITKSNIKELLLDTMGKYNLNDNDLNIFNNELKIAMEHMEN